MNRRFGDAPAVASNGRLGPGSPSWARGTTSIFNSRTYATAPTGPPRPSAVIRARRNEDFAVAAKTLPRNGHSSCSDDQGDAALGTVVGGAQEAAPAKLQTMAAIYDKPGPFRTHIYLGHAAMQHPHCCHSGCSQQCMRRGSVECRTCSSFQMRRKLCEQLKVP